MICEIPGEGAVVLARVDDAFERLEGELCGPCGDEFRARREIRGWAIVAPERF